MKDRVSAGLQQLQLAEMRAISRRDMRHAASLEEQRNERARVAVAESYSFYDNGNNIIHTSDSVASYVNKANQQLTRKNDPFAEWHTRRDGKISKNVPHRFVQTAERIIADFSKGE